MGRTATCCAAAVYALLPGAVLAASFQTLGFPEGHSGTLALDISADGSTVVGAASGDQFGISAFRWTQTGGYELLGHLPEGIAGFGQAVSADGSITAGYDTHPQGRLTAVLWQVDGQALSLAVPSDGTTGSIGYALSDDGTTVVGQASYVVNSGPNILQGEAFRWTAETGIESLGKLPGLDDSSLATDVSADGSAVVGWGRQTAPWLQEAFVWTAERGLQGLGHLPGQLRSAATAVSADGSTVVGISIPEPLGQSQNGFMWTAADGMRSLGTIPGFNYIDPVAVSADGSVVVGNLHFHAASDEGDAQEPFIWTRQHGLVRLGDVLQYQGVDISGLTVGNYRLGTATGISADGRRISGWDDFGQGVVAWLAEISFDFPQRGDTNADGRVDMKDLNNVRNGFAGAGSDDGTLLGDAFPFDGLVDIDDLNAVRNNFGAGVAAVPEPSTCALALSAVAWFVGAGRRRCRSFRAKPSRNKAFFPEFKRC